jgi:hypothetical protein
LKIDFSSTGLTTNDFLKVYSTPILKNSCLSFKRYLKYQQITRPYGLTTINLLTQWEVIHGLTFAGHTFPTNCAIGFRFVMCNRSTGLQSPVLDMIIIKT